MEAYLTRCLARVLYGYIILDNLFVTTYGCCPQVSISLDCNIEMPGDQELWDCITEDQWMARVLESRLNVQQATLRDAVIYMMTEENCLAPPQSPWYWSPVAASLVIHALSIYLSHVKLNGVSAGLGTESLPGMSPCKTGDTTLIKTALARYRGLMDEATMDIDPMTTEAEEQALFSIAALVRSVTMRVCITPEALDRTVLLQNDKSTIVEALSRFVTIPQARGEGITMAIDYGIDSLTIALDLGPLLVRKSAALTWSLEHAIMNWDQGMSCHHLLYLSLLIHCDLVGSLNISNCYVAVLCIAKWTHTIQESELAGDILDPLEQATLNKLRAILERFGASSRPGTLLSAALLRVKASFYDDTWVWGGEFLERRF